MTLGDRRPIWLTSEQIEAITHLEGTTRVRVVPVGAEVAGYYVMVVQVQVYRLHLHGNAVPGVEVSMTVVRAAPTAPDNLKFPEEETI